MLDRADFVKSWTSGYGRSVSFGRSAQQRSKISSDGQYLEIKHATAVLPQAT